MVCSPSLLISFSIVIPVSIVDWMESYFLDFWMRFCSTFLSPIGFMRDILCFVFSGTVLWRELKLLNEQLFKVVCIKSYMFPLWGGVFWVIMTLRVRVVAQVICRVVSLGAVYRLAQIIIKVSIFGNCRI